jgi:hypothetical protein
MDWQPVDRLINLIDRCYTSESIYCTALEKNINCIKSMVKFKFRLKNIEAHLGFDEKRIKIKKLHTVQLLRKPLVSKFITSCLNLINDINTSRATDNLIET